MSAAVALMAGGLAPRTAVAQSLSSDPAALLNRIEFLERQVRYLSERQNDSRQVTETREVKEVPVVDPAATAAATGEEQRRRGSPCVSASWSRISAPSPAEWRTYRFRSDG